MYLIILIVLCLCSCNVDSQIYNSLYVSSVAVDYKDDSYIASCLVFSSSSVGNSGKKEDENEDFHATFSDKSLNLAFDNIERSVTLNLNYKHVSTLLISINIFENNKFEEVIDYFFDNNNFTNNFYIFIVKDEIDDIYNIKNPNDEALDKSILASPLEDISLYKTSKPLHFINMLRDLSYEKEIKIPYLKLQKIWYKDKAINSLMIEGHILFKPFIDNCKIYYFKGRGYYPSHNKN